MGGFYQLNPLGFKLAAGAHVLPAETMSPVSQAQLLVEAAQARAGQTAVEAATAFEAERQRGFRQGSEEAVLAATERLLLENQTLDQGLAQTERDLARLVASCVRKLVDGFDDIERVSAIVRSALKQMRQEKRAQVRVAPALAARLKAASAAIAKEFPEIEMIDIVADPALEATHVIVETSIGRVDGDIGKRLDELERVVLLAQTAQDIPTGGSAHGSAA